MGLTPEEAYRVTFIRAIIARDIDKEDLKNDYTHLVELVKSAIRSAETTERVYVGGAR